MKRRREFYFAAGVIYEFDEKPYTEIDRNILHVEFEYSHFGECTCDVNDISPCTIESRCINVHSKVECSESCPAAEKCGNKNFQQATHCSVQIRKTEKKGLGLFAGENIEKDSFIIEYMGEVINDTNFKKRSKSHENPNFYFLKLNENLYIDAFKFGNVSRYVNHSCNPNAEPYRWIVPSNGRDEVRLAFFAKRKIYKVSPFHLI